MTGWRRRPDRRRGGWLVLVAVTPLAGCSIQPNSAPRDLPDDQRPQLDPQPEAGQAIGSGRVFFTDGGGDDSRLRSVPREAEPGAPIIGALLDGPNEDELDEGLQSALPPGLDLNSARVVGNTFTIDVTDELLNLNSAQLRIAIAQLVFTASQIEGVLDVRILVDEVGRPWPDGGGASTAEPLSPYDFPGLAETSQPRYPIIPSPPPPAPDGL